MPNWKKLVRQRLAGLALSAAERDEVQEELASHLEDTYELLRTKGLPEHAAMGETLREVTDWNKLRRQIQSARKKEDTMNDRVRQLWLPGLTTMFLFMGLLMLIQLYGPDPVKLARKNAWTFIAPVAVVYMPWLASLPLIGALGAYLSRRGGGSKRAVLSAVSFPVLPYLLFFIVAMPILLLQNHRLTPSILFSALIVGLFAWVVAPVTALLAGAWLVQFYSDRRLDHRRAVTG